MKYLVTIVLLFVSIGAFAQKPDEKNLGQASAALMKALVERDSVKLKSLLFEGVTYGHSNGWVQNKDQVIGDLFNGKLTYQEISGPEYTVDGIEGNTAADRLFNVNVKATLDGKKIELKLDILMVWIWEDKRWQLFARQSVKK